MNYTVIFTPLADETLDEITTYISTVLDNHIAAERLIANIYDTAELLKTMPEMYRIYDVEPYKSRGIRFYIVKNFKVFYKVDEPAKTVYILKICYARQSPENQTQDI